MNHDDIQSAWNSGANRPAPAAAALLKDSLVRQLRRERWRDLAWLAWTCLLLGILTAHLFPWFVFHGRFIPRTDWMLVPLLALPWGFVLFFLRRFLARRPGAAAADRSVLDALRAAQAQNRAAATTLKGVWLLQAVFVLLLPFVVHQLHADGKVAGRELGQMAFLFGGAIAAGAGFVAVKYFRVVRPEAARLAALLRSYE